MRGEIIEFFIIKQIKKPRLVLCSVLFHKYWDLSIEMTVMRQSFCRESQPISDANDEISLVKNYRSRRLIGRTIFFTSEKWSYGKLRHPWRENWQAAFLFSRCLKGLWTSVQLTILLKSKKTNVKATLQKHTTRCKTFAEPFRNPEWT